MIADLYAPAYAAVSDVAAKSARVGVVVDSLGGTIMRCPVVRDALTD